MRKLILILAFIPTSLWAEDWGSARVIDGGVLASGAHIIGLEMDLNEGWKTYFVDPGQNGLAPLIELQQGEMTIAPKINWPEPHLFVADDLPSVGYKGKVVFPMTFETTSTDNITLKADLGVCEHICVPAQLEFEFNPNMGYSFDGVSLSGQSPVHQAEICDWSEAQIRATFEESPLAMVSDGKSSYIFSTWDDFSAHYKAPYRLALYGLSEEAVTPEPCPPSS